jgi:hypothetical protein
MARWKKLLLVGVGLLVLFAVTGFFIAPPLVKARMLRELSKRLGREVSVGSVAINPFELSMTVRNLRIMDKDGKPFASWDRAYANYRFTSFLSHDFTFDELSFDNPYARFVINQDGTLNIDDLLRIFRAAPAEAPKGPPPAWNFAVVHVTGARVGFTDRQRTPVFESTIGPFELSVEKFSTSPNSDAPYGFQGQTESGETFSWKGRISSNPLHSSGEITLTGIRLPKYRPYYQTGRPFNVSNGTISVTTRYDAVWTDAQKSVRVEGAHLTLDHAVIGRPGIEQPDITVDKLEVSGADVDLLTLAAKIEKVSLQGGHVLIRNDPNAGGVNLHTMVRPFLEGKPGTPAVAGASATPPTPPRPLSIGALSLSGLSVDVEDLAPARPYKVSAHDVALSVTGIDTAPGTTCATTISAKVGDEGSIDVKGTFAADFHHGDLDADVAKIDMRPSDVYIDLWAKLRIARGSAGGKGHVKFDLPDQGDMAFAFEGELRLADVALVHADTAHDLLKLAALKIAPVSIRMKPLKLAIGEVALGAPQLAIAIAPDRTIDLAQAFGARPEPDPGAAPAAPTPAPAEAAAKSSSSPIPPIAIDTVRIQNGSIRIDDHSVEPIVTTTLGRLSGTIKGISTDELAKANVDLTAMVDDVAPLAMKGQINPIAHKDYTDLTLSAKGIDLIPYSPYCGKYLGYGIGKGKLGAELGYKISERRFKSTNVFTIEQFGLGDKVESPDALHLPVKLAVAVLRDKDGQIVLDVPAEGSVDDPSFRLGKVIVRAIVNLLTKIVTSPFKLLAGAFGAKDQNIEYQDFAPGSAELTEPERAKLDVVAKSLHARPALTLSVQGSVDQAADTAALEKAKLDDLVRAAKWKSVSASDPAKSSPESVTVGPDEYPRWLQAAYDAAFPSQGAPPATPLPVDAMEARLRGTSAVGLDDLRALAAARAKSVRDYLTTQGGIPPERVFMTEAVKKEGRPPAARVWLELQ